MTPPPTRTPRLFLAAVVFLAILQALSAQPSDWALTNWKARKCLSNLNPATGATLTNFPVCIRLTNDLFLSRSASANGDDLTFTGADGAQLFHEIENFDRTTGQLTAYVRVPLLSNQTAVWLYLSNDRPVRSFSASGADGADGLSGSFASLRNTNISSRVWDSNFMVVLHFAETTGLYLDSTRWNHSNSILSNFLVRNATGPTGGKAVSFPYNGIFPYTNMVPLRFNGGYTSPQPALSNMWYGSNYSMTTLLWLSNSTGWYFQPANVPTYWVNPLTPNPNSMSIATFRAAGGGNWNWRFGSNAENGGFYGTGSMSTSSLSLSNRWVCGQIDYRTISLSTPGPGATIEAAFYTNGAASRYVNNLAVTTNFMASQNAPLDLGGAFNVCPVAIYDEFRLSGTFRGSNWCATESSNLNAPLGGSFFRIGTNEIGDLTPPVLGTFPSADLATNLDFTASLSVNEGTGWWSTNGGATWTSFDTNGTTVGISNTVTVLFFGVDAWSNVSATNVRAYGVGSDAVAPVVTLLPPASLVTNAAFSATISVDENSAFWTTNGWSTSQTVAMGTGTVNVSQTVTLAYFARDVFGNAVATNSVTYAFDTVPPIPSATGIATNAGTVSISLSANEGTLFYTTNAWTQTLSVATGFTNVVTVLDGERTLSFWARDQAGNVCATNTLGLVSDTNAPVVTVSPGPFTNDAPFMVVLSVPETNGFWSTNEGATWGIITNLPVTNWISNGTVSLLTRGVDLLGNAGATNRREYRVDPAFDVAPPVLTYIGPASGWRTNRDFPVTLMTEKPSGFYGWDGVNWTPFGPGAVRITVGAGVSTLHVTTRNANGFQGTTNRWTYSNDQTAPTVRGIPDSLTTNRAVTVRLEVDEPLGFWSTNAQISSNAFSNAAEISFTSDATLFTWAIDAFGNASRTNVSSVRIVAEPVFDASNRLDGIVNGRVATGSFSFTFATTGPPSIEIFSLGGILVRSLATESGGLDAVRKIARWDGRDQAGRWVPPGPYVILLKVAGRIRDQKKIVLIP